MFFYSIIIASNDHNYNILLANKLESYYRQSARIEIFADSSNEEVTGCQQAETVSDRKMIMFLGTAIDGCKRECENCRSQKNCRTYQLLNGPASANAQARFFFESGRNCKSTLAKDDTVKWPASITTIINLLETMISEDSAELNESIPEVPTAENNEDEGTICMRLQLSGESINNLKEIIKKQIGQGIKVYYLAIMPGWLMHLCCTPDTAGPDLSTLLLSIHQRCQPEADKIGVFAQLHPDGYFQFRPPARADDMICCDPEHLRKMLTMIRRKVKSDGSNTFCWVDCRDISMLTAGRLAALCDHLLLELSSGEDFASASARREAGLMLAALPNSCGIFECTQQLAERLGLCL